MATMSNPIPTPREFAETACAVRNQLRHQHRHTSAAEIAACAGCRVATTDAEVAYFAYLRSNARTRA